jgi:hypothetical protein
MNVDRRLTVLMLVLVAAVLIAGLIALVLFPGGGDD